LLEVQRVELLGTSVEEITSRIGCDDILAIFQATSRDGAQRALEFRWDDGGLHLELVISRLGESVVLEVHDLSGHPSHDLPAWQTNGRGPATQPRTDVRMAPAANTQDEQVRMFAQGVAHDVSNITQVVAGYAELLSDHPSQATVDAAARGLGNAASRALLVTERLRNLAEFSRVDKNRIDLARLVRGDTDMLRGLLGTEIELTVEADGEAWILANADQIESALENRCENAATALGGAGGVKIAVTEHEEEVLLSVSDNGPGISPVVAEQLFDPFVSTRSGPGTGMGLFLIRSYLATCGGTIEVSSSLAGATFLLRFPSL
jgi:signal transduction histidine kinase